MNLTEFKAFTFPGGERHFQIEALEEPLAYLRANIRCSDDIMDLMLVTHYLRSHRAQPWALYLPYVPYARQDRPTTDGSPFSLHCFASMVNLLGYKEVHVYEPHSDVTPALIDNCCVHTMESHARQFIESINDPILVAPDASASKRVQKLTTGPFLQAVKRRDPSTGRLVLDSLYGECRGRDAVMIDDLCDGGATFIPLAEELWRRGARSVSLFVAHGLFSKGLDALREAGIDRFGTTDSFYRGQSDELVTVFEAIP